MTGAWETMPPFVLIAIDANGRMRAGQTFDKWVPNDFCRPGEIAFTLRVEDFQARHTHEPSGPDHFDLQP